MQFKYQGISINELHQKKLFLTCKVNLGPEYILIGF